MSTQSLPEQIRVLLPKYLTPARQRDLWAEIRSFPQVENFYLPEGSVEQELLQGDGWRGFLAVNVQTLDRKPVAGLIVSNSCDIDLRNERALLPRVLFAPLVSVAAYGERLREAGQSDEQIDSCLTSIRRQETSNIFCLPEAPYGPKESLVLFDDLHQQSVRNFVAGKRTCLFRLNQLAFYVLLIKLSIHFTRFNENVGRFPLAEAS